jgi:transcriptional regulator of acetoin/glycerol metabolism
VISRLAEQLSGLCAGVLLSDRNARIVRRWAPDLSFIGLLDQTCSAVGYSGSEEHVGTNGIGTATEERAAKIVIGAEHFADILTPFTCVGVPIRHPLSRRFEGTITLSAKMEAASPLILPFFTGVALEIEQQLLQQASLRERFLLDAFMTASNRGRAVAVIGSGIFMSGPKAQRSLAGVDPATVWEQIVEALKGSTSGSALRTQVVTPQGPVNVTCESLFDDLRLVGALLGVDDDADHEPSAAERLEQFLAPRSNRPITIPDEMRHALPGKSSLWIDVLTQSARHQSGLQPVLLLGEPGAGKSTLAQFFCEGGAESPSLHIVECATTSNPMILKAFNHALQADEGTIFLRHIDALDAATSRNLSVQIEAYLATGRHPRIIASATPLSDLVIEPGYQRLIDLVGAVRIELPALRARSEDIPDLVTQINKETEGYPPRFSQQAMLALKRAPWPGNIRQLETVVRSVAHSARGREITVEMLPSEIGVHSMRRQLTAMEQVELEAILSALGRCRGNKVNAARELGISRSTLYRKMASYQLDPDHAFF